MNRKELQPLIDVLSLAEHWEIEIDSKGGITTKLNGTPASLQKGLKMLSDEDETELDKLSDKVVKNIEAKIMKKQFEQLLKGWK